VAVFAFNVVAKLVFDVAGVALGASSSGVTASLLLAVGLMLAGEAAVVWARLEGGSLPGAHRSSVTAGGNQK